MWQRSTIRFILRHRQLVLWTTIAITGAMSFCMVRLSFDSSIDTWFMENDPDLATYNEFLDRFAADEITVVGMFAEDVFAPEVLATIDRLTRALGREPFCHRVTSLTNVRIPRGSEGSVQIAPLFETLPETRAQAEPGRQLALRSGMLESLVSRDGRATAIVFEIAHEGTDFESKTALVRTLRSMLELEVRPGLTFKLSGSPPMDEAFYRYSNRDFARFAPLTVAIVLLVMMLLFRTISAALVPLVVVLVGCVWLFGLMGAMGIKINMMSVGLVTIVLAVGVADTIHVLSDYYQELARGHAREFAVERAWRTLLTPCFFTTATTAAGMLALSATDLKPIQNFGVLGATGVVFAFFLSMTFAPVALLMVRPPNQQFIARQRRGALTGVLRWMGEPSMRRSVGTLTAAAAVLSVAGAGLWHLEVGANSMNYFHRDDPVRRDIEAIDAALGGSASAEFIVHAPGEGLKNPEVLARVDAMQTWLEKEPGVTQTISVVDSLKEMGRVLHEGDERGFVVPATRALAAQLYLLLEGEDDFESLVQDAYSVGRVTARIQMSRADALIAKMPQIEARLRRDFDDDQMSVATTGTVKLMSEMESYLLRSQIRSLLLAGSVITLMLLLLLGSWRLALLSMIPNFTPVLVVLGVMFLVGIPLDPGTVMIGSIALGLVVDDTVHFLVRFRRFIKAGETLEGAIAGTVHGAGRPIIVTSIVLAGSFSILMLGSFTPNVNFGAVTSVVIIMALVADLVVLPAALLVLRPRFA